MKGVANGRDAGGFAGAGGARGTGGACGAGIASTTGAAASRTTGGDGLAGAARGGAESEGAIATLELCEKANHPIPNTARSVANATIPMINARDVGEGTPCGCKEAFA
jgi:hypothetical protein